MTKQQVPSFRKTCVSTYMRQIYMRIRGKSKCNLITDLSVMPGFEASTLVSFVSNDKDTALSRTRVKHILFKVKSSYENIGFKNF